jgi:hypothetical protein
MLQKGWLVVVKIIFVFFAASFDFFIMMDTIM